jgi:hypothetical protein
MKQEALFNQVMSRGLRAWLDEQAGARDHAKRQEIQRFALGAVAGAVVVLVAMAIFPEQQQFGFMAGAMIVAWAWHAASQPVREISEQIKVRANEELGAALGLSYQAYGEPSADFELATQMGLLPSDPDEAYFFDFWTGQLGTSEGQLHEAHLQEYRQNGKRRELVTVFRGVVIGYQFARSFSSTTLVKADQGMFNGLANWAARFSGLQLEPVKMVHPDFEEKFEVTSTDQVEARYLLHPAFCERLMETVDAFQGQNMRLAFVEGRVVMAIETNDLFESGGIDAEKDEARIARTIEQIGNLIDLTQTLNERPR